MLILTMDTEDRLISVILVDFLINFYLHLDFTLKKYRGIGEEKECFFYSRY